MFETLARGMSEKKWIREQPGIYSLPLIPKDVSIKNNLSQDAVIATTPTSLHYVKDTFETGFFLSSGYLVSFDEGPKIGFVAGEKFDFGSGILRQFIPEKGENLEAIVTTFPRFDPANEVEVKPYQMTPEELEMEEKALETHLVPRTEDWEIPFRFEEAE